MLLVACGLLSEAEIARGRVETLSPVVVAGGGDAALLEAELRRHAPGARGVLSFGVAGGLAPALRVGDLRVARAVLAPGGTCLAADAAWAQRLVARLGCAPPALFACATRPVARPEDKAALHRSTTADVVDMESSIAAKVAADLALPFAAIRVVTDSAARALPPAVTVSMRPGGALDLPAILRSVMKRPGQIPGLIRTGRDSRVAFAALLCCRERLGPGFALLDLG